MEATAPIVEARRLMGPNLFSRRMGAVLEVEPMKEPGRAESGARAWAHFARALSAAIGWPEPEIHVRTRRAGTSRTAGMPASGQLRAPAPLPSVKVSSSNVAQTVRAIAASYTSARVEWLRRSSAASAPTLAITSGSRASGCRSRAPRCANAHATSAISVAVMSPSIGADRYSDVPARRVRTWSSGSGHPMTAESSRA